MGWENIFHCEWGEFGQRVLKHYWPGAISYGDITKTDFTIHRGNIDILTGGFPCQPYSLAGKRKGTADERHLWPEMLRAIGEIQPSWVVGENVFGLVNWDGGMVFNQVQADLEAQGYEVFPYVLPACAVNAPHRRDRIWFVAYRNSNGQHECHSRHEVNPSERRLHAFSNISEGAGHGATTNSHYAGNDTSRSGANGNRPAEDINREQSFVEVSGCGGTNDANTTGEGLERCIGSELQRGINGLTLDSTRDVTNTRDTGLQGGAKQRSIGSSRTQRNEQPTRLLPSDWQEFPTQSPVCSGNDGVPSGLAGITVSKHRQESIKGYGNAIVPQVALQIFKAIDQYQELIFDQAA